MHRLLTLRLAAWRARRLLRALLLALLVGVAVRLATPPPSPSSPVVVAARAVDAGHPLTGDDLRTVRLPSNALPHDAPSTLNSVLGRRAAVDLPEGLVLVPEVLADGRFDREPPPGTVVVPVVLDGAASLRLGDSIEVVAGAACAEAAQPFAVPAVVIGLGGGAGGDLRAVTDGGLTSGLGLGSAGSGGNAADDAILIAVAPETGRKVGEIVWNCRLSAVIVP